VGETIFIAAALLVKFRKQPNEEQRGQGRNRGNHGSAEREMYNFDFWF
jgi:hypothetical protein